MPPCLIAILGAESTGKTQLAGELANALRWMGHSVAVVTETLREFCDARARTPRKDEQAAIATEHTRRIEAAGAQASIVIADTTVLQTAVYSDIVFSDRSLYAEAETWQRERVDVTLLTAIDLPWRADGLQRDGPQVREPVDGLLRAALGRAGVAYSVVSGSGSARAEAALAAVRSRADRDISADSLQPRWRWCCERCGDAAMRPASIDC